MLYIKERWFFDGTDKVGFVYVAKCIRECLWFYYGVFRIGFLYLDVVAFRKVKAS